MSRNVGLIVAGGGTGGHVLAGVAIAECWRAEGAPIGVSREVLFVGARGGIEEKIVPKSGYNLETLSLGSLNRVGLKRKILTLIQIPLALLHSLRILLREKPCAVIGVGGYASGPFVLVAHMCSYFFPMRVAILEQNAVPGLTNRLLSHWVDEIFLAFPVDASVFPKAKKTVTGNPTRSQMMAMPSAPRRPFTIFIFGGSQGAQGINTLVLDALPYLKDLQGDLRWIHQTGEKEKTRVEKGYAAAGVAARIEAFIFDMAACYQAASLVICRAGSSTLSELASVGRSSVLIPYPFASDNHQELNARIFEKAGAAKVFLQGKTPGQDLAAWIRKSFLDATEIDAMERAMLQFARPQAAKEIVSRLGALC